MNTPAAAHTLACVAGAGFFLGEGRKSRGRVRGEKERKRLRGDPGFLFPPSS